MVRLLLQFFINVSKIGHSNLQGHDVQSERNVNEVVELTAKRSLIT